MENSFLSQLLIGQAICLLLIVASFVAWFKLRETPEGDWACTVVAISAAALLFLSMKALAPFGCFGSMFGIPGLIALVWFMGLRRARRQESRIRQWGKKHGYRIITIERQYGAQSRSGSLRSRAELRVTARRRADGQFLVGWVSDTGFSFGVLWDPIPTRHVGHGLHVPNPPHADPPAPSKQ